MNTILELSKAEQDFMSKFKNICRKSGGDLDLINKSLISGDMLMSQDQKRALEATLEAQYHFAGPQKLH